jgi:hypothetical protein
MTERSQSPLKLIYADDELDEETDALLSQDHEHTVAPSASTTLRDLQHIAEIIPGSALLHSSAFNACDPQAHQHAEADADLLHQGALRGKRRWVGVMLIFLLNLVSSFGYALTWGYSSDNSTIAFAPMASVARDHFGFSNMTAINWLTLCSGFVYFLASPLSILVTRLGAKQALLAGSALLIVGSVCAVFPSDMADNSGYALLACINALTRLFLSAHCL